MSLEKSFPIYKKTHASGNVGWRVDMGLVGGKRVFKSFPNEAAAAKFQKRCLEAEAKKKPVDLRDLNDVMRHEVLAALAKLRDHNATIAQAVDFYLKHARPAKANVTIGEVMDEFKAKKLKGGQSSKYINTAWSSFFVPFRDHFKNCFMTELTSEDCELYAFKSKTWSPTTRRTHIRHLSVLCNFAVAKGFVGYNPFKTVTKPKKPAGTSKERVVSVENVIKLLRYALAHNYKAECASLVLVLFCGVRVEEVSRLTWADIKLDEETPVVVLDEGITKTGKSRINPIPSNAQVWLKMLRSEGKVTSENYEGRMRYLRSKAKADFKQNSARISFASYHLARYGNGPKTAFLLGHDNPTLLYNTYKALVTKDESIRYWKITPDYDGVERDLTPTADQINEARRKGIAKALATKG
ncbi:MAG: site-specific integrase [Verrucomicrobia bacterium]|nr:site-specific integrase [Verrucomicrobiota bacterium]